MCSVISPGVSEPSDVIDPADCFRLEGVCVPGHRPGDRRCVPTSLSFTRDGGKFMKVENPFYNFNHIFIFSDDILLEIV